MLYARLLIGLIIPLLLGISALSALFKEKLAFFSYWERWALSCATGIWILVLIMFCLPFIKISLNFLNISLASILVLIVLFPLARKYLLLFKPIAWPQRKSFIFYFLLALIILKLLFVSYNATLKPMIDPDIIKCYALAAKHTFLNEAPLYASNKPPLPFLIESWPVICWGQWYDNLLPLFYPLMYLSLLIIFYCSLKRYLSALRSIFFTFLLASIPLLLFHAGTAYTDFPMAFYYSISTFYLFQFAKELKISKERACSFLLVSLLLLGISVWVKKSASLYYAGINLLILVSLLFSQRNQFNKKDWQQIIFASFIFLIAVSPWLAYHKFVNFDTFYGQALPAFAQTFNNPFSKFLVIIIAMFRNMFWESNWQLTWPLFFALLISYPKKSISYPNVILVAIIMIQLAAIFMVFAYTELFRFVFDDTLLNRLMLHSIPVVLYACAILSKSLNPAE